VRAQEDYLQNQGEKTVISVLESRG